MYSYYCLNKTPVLIVQTGGVMETPGTHVVPQVGEGTLFHSTMQEVEA